MTEETWRKDTIMDTLKATIKVAKIEGIALPDLINTITRVYMGWDEVKQPPEKEGPHGN
jgi:hypothetical protein